MLSHSVKGTTHTNVYLFGAPCGVALENIHFVNYKTWKQDCSPGLPDEPKERIRIDLNEAETRTGIRNYSHVFGIVGAYKNAATLREVFSIGSRGERGGAIHCLEIAG